jgi:uncharacterized protein (TIGR02996 family)
VDDFDDEAPTNPGSYDVDLRPSVNYGATETQFLTEIRANPQDFALRTVYADWLEQEGKTREAELVRLLSVDPRERTAERERIRELGVHAPNDWLATLSRGVIDGCEQELRRRCTQRWDTLATTDQPRLRSCTECERDVRFAAKLEMIRGYGDASQRVVYSPVLEFEDAIDLYDGRVYPDGGPTYRERRGRRLSGAPTGPIVLALESLD